MPPCAHILRTAIAKKQFYFKNITIFECNIDRNILSNINLFRVFWTDSPHAALGLEKKTLIFRKKKTSEWNLL